MVRTGSPSHGPCPSYAANWTSDWTMPKFQFTRLDGVYVVHRSGCRFGRAADPVGAQLPIDDIANCLSHRVVDAVQLAGAKRGEDLFATSRGSGRDRSDANKHCNQRGDDRPQYGEPQRDGFASHVGSSHFMTRSYTDLNASGGTLTAPCRG